MNKWTALYYPEVEPPARWLRSAALFFDTVTSFVPAESGDTLSDELRKFEDATGAWIPYIPSESTASLVDVPVDKLDDAFIAIAAEREGTPEKLQVNIEFRGGEIHVKDHAFMHGSKLSPLVRERLCAHGLMLPDLSQSLQIGDWWIVDERASDLVLSHIADKLAANKGWTTITDNESCYAFTSLDRGEAVSGQKVAEDELARLLVTELVPETVDALPIKKYVELRHRYEPIREQLISFVDEATTENRLKDIGDPLELRQALQEYVKDLTKEIQNFKESGFGRNFRKWGTFTLGSFVTITAALAAPDLALPLAGVSILVGAVDRAGWLEQEVTRRSEMVRLVASARKDIIGHPSIGSFS